MRGSRELQSLQLEAQAGLAQERAASTKAPADVHAAGIAQMFVGDLDGSVSSLQSASQFEPRNARFKSDLGAALMTRFVNTGDQADATAALAAFDEALALSPSLHEALFNKALLLQQLERLPEAVAAWDKYLAASPEPQWREEAIRQRDAAQRQ
jgi:cytochrome c-type biogenesis protein CcmH/NrfG